MDVADAIAVLSVVATAAVAFFLLTLPLTPPDRGPDLWETLRAEEERFERMLEVSRAARAAVYPPVPPRKKVDPTYPVKVRGETAGETRKARLAVYRSDTGSSLYRAMLANPGDDVPRGVLADWLDEQGFPGAAARMRGGGK